MADIERYVLEANVRPTLVSDPGFQYETIIAIPTICTLNRKDRRESSGRNRFRRCPSGTGRRDSRKCGSPRKQMVSLS